MAMRTRQQRKTKNRAAPNLERDATRREHAGQFPDNRLDAAAQRKLQELVQSPDSPMRFDAAAEKSVLPSAFRHPIQHAQSEAAHPLQCKSVLTHRTGAEQSEPQAKLARMSAAENAILQRQSADAAELADADFGYEEDPDDWDAEAFAEPQSPEAVNEEDANSRESHSEEASEYEDDPDDWDAEAFSEAESEHQEGPAAEHAEDASHAEQEPEARREFTIEPGSELAAWFADEPANPGVKKTGRFGAMKNRSRKAAKKTKAGAKKGVYKVFDNPLAVKAASGTVALVAKVLKEIITYAGSKASSGSAKVAQVASWAGLGLNIGSLLLSLKGLVTARETRDEIKNQKSSIEEENEALSEEKAERGRLLHDRLRDIVWKVRNKAIDVVQSVIGIASSILALGAVLIAPVIAAANLALTTLRLGVMLGDRVFRKDQGKQRKKDAKTIAMGVLSGKQEDCDLVLAMGVPSVVSRLTTKASEYSRDDEKGKRKGKKVKDAASLIEFANKLPKGKPEGEQTYTFESFVSEIYNGLNKF